MSSPQFLKNAEQLEREFTAEMSVTDTYLKNGDAFASLLNRANDKNSVAGKYTTYIKEQIATTEKNIVDLKNADKFYRREFIEDNPLLASLNPFWTNTDNRILFVFWVSISIFMVSLTFTLMAAIADMGTRTFTIIMVWIMIPGFILYILQNIG
jgi:hypothetical protein